jgi:hypothetical protein
MKAKRCLCCKRESRATWKCRDCGRETCEHFCGNKSDDGTATCGGCRIKSAHSGWR